MRAGDAVHEDERLDVLLACQPVYTRESKVAAFEILLHGENASRAATVADIEATVAVMLGTYGSICQNGRLQAVPSFLRVARGALLDAALPELPKKQYILEVAESTRADEPLCRRLGELAGKGYRIALADYDPANGALDPLLEVARIVKLDARRLGPAGLEAAVAKLRPHGVELLANNLDDRDRFDACRALDFDYYQGDFLSAREPVKGKKLGNNKPALMQLLAELDNSAATPASLEEIAIKDANLTYKILRVVNSAAAGLRQEVASVSQAIALLGTEETKRWVNLFLLEGEDGKPEELMRNMLVRARMCEILAELAGRGHALNHFIVGLLSQYDALTDIAMPELMEQIPLNREAKDALLQRTGSPGQILAEVERYEKGRFDELEWLLEKSFYEVAYRHSTAWAKQVQFAMQG